MIKKLHEEWERLTDEVRLTPEGENAQSHQVLERMNAVSSALRRLTQGSVTRTTLSEAVRGALSDILQGDRDTLFPELATLREQMASLQEELRQNREREPKAPAKELEAGLKTLAGEVAGDVGRIDARLQSIESALDAKLRLLEERILERISSLSGLHSASESAGSLAPPAAAAEEMAVDILHGPLAPENVDDGRISRLEALLEESGERATEWQARLHALQTTLQSRLAELSGLVGAEEKRRTTLGLELTSVDDHLAEGLKELEGRIVGRIGEMESSLANVTSALETRLRQSLAAVETRLVEADGKLDARFMTEIRPQIETVRKDLLAKIAEIASAQSETESRLRSQWGSEMYQLEEKVSTLVDLVGQVHAALPTRQLLEGLDDRLLRIESRFRTVTDQLEGLELAMPELKSLSEQLTGIRGDLSGLTADLSNSEKDLQGVKESLARKVQDMQDLLRSGIERWEADRANQRQRLVDLRDTLRDQLQMALQRTAAGTGGLLGKLRARPDGGLRLDQQEWERFRARMETILQGLESLLTE